MRRGLWPPIARVSNCRGWRKNAFVILDRFAQESLSFRGRGGGDTRCRILAQQGGSDFGSHRDVETPHGRPKRMLESNRSECE